MKKGIIFLLAASTLFGLGFMGHTEKVEAAAESYTTTWKITSKTAVSASGGVAQGVSASYTTTYGSNANQLTKGNNSTLTVNGLEGFTIKDIKMSMKSNKSAGAGTLTVKAGNTTLATGSGTFKGSWYSNYTQSYVSIDVTNKFNLKTDYTIGTGETFTINVAATTNSLYVESYTVTYEKSEDDGKISLEAPVVTLDEETGLVTWNDIENASGYVINVNGTETSLNGVVNQYQLVSGQTFMVKAVGDNVSYTDSGYSNEVTYYTKTKYSLVTDARLLKEGDTIVIVSSTSNKVLSKTQNSNNRGIVEITKENDSILIPDGGNAQVLTLKAGKANGTFALDTGSGYLYAASSSDNYLRTESTLSNNSSWKIDISATGVATIVAQGTNTRNRIKYNSNNNIFSCYATGQGDVSIYKLEELRDATSDDISKINSLVTSYKNNGKYTKDTTINLATPAQDELASLASIFWAGSSVLTRTTYYDGEALWMTNGNDKYSYYGTSGNNLTHATVSTLGEHSDKVGIYGTTMEEHYYTMNDIVANLKQVWKVKVDEGNNVYTTENENIIEMFKGFVSPCYLGYNEKLDINNYIDITSAEIEETANGLELRLISELDYAKLVDGTTVFAQATVNAGWTKYSTQNLAKKHAN